MTFLQLVLIPADPNDQMLAVWLLIANRVYWSPGIISCKSILTITVADISSMTLAAVTGACQKYMHSLLSSSEC